MSRYSGRYRPACRMIHTGTRGTASPRHACRNKSFRFTDLWTAMCLFGWLLAVTYLALELYQRQRSVGALVVPFILLFFVGAHLAPADKLSPPPAHGPLFAFHVALNILAYSAFALAFVLSLTFLI